MNNNPRKNLKWEVLFWSEYTPFFLGSIIFEWFKAKRIEKLYYRNTFSKLLPLFPRNRLKTRFWKWVKEFSLTPNFDNVNAYFVNSWPSLACRLESWSQKLFLIEQVDSNDFLYSKWIMIKGNKHEMGRTNLIRIYSISHIL